MATSLVSIPSRAGNAAACSSAYISQGQKPAFALTSVKTDSSSRILHIKITQYHNKHELTRALTSRGFSESHRLAQTALSEGKFRIKCGMTVSGWQALCKKLDSQTGSIQPYDDCDIEKDISS
ncbi:hypothetical protein [Pseudoalteromonas rubra]